MMFNAIAPLLLSLAPATMDSAPRDPQDAAAPDRSAKASEDDLSDGLAKYDPPDEDRKPDLGPIWHLAFRHQTDEAIAELTKLIAQRPKDATLLAARATIHRDAGHYDQALADAAAALKIDDELVHPRTLLATIFRDQGRPADALAEAGALAKHGSDLSAQLGAGVIYSSLGDYEKSSRVFKRALGIDDENGLYLYRSLSRPKQDLSGRMADLDKAWALLGEDRTPLNRITAYGQRGELLRAMGDLPGSIAAYSAGIVLSPTNEALLTGRGISQTIAGNAAEAETDFALARANAPDEQGFLKMCSEKALAGVALASALEDCNVALPATTQRWKVLDTRGLVFLRLGRLDDAIRDFDEVLATEMHPATSYLGRAIAWSRKGDAQRAAADLAAARRANPGTEGEFAFYGLRMP